MAQVVLAVAFSFSVGALVLFIGLGARRFRSIGLRMVRQTVSRNCLGRMVERHSEYCSSECPLAARCALLAMDDYMRTHPGMMSPHDSSGQC